MVDMGTVPGPGGGGDGGGRGGDRGGNDVVVDTRAVHRASWAEMLGSTLPSGWNKNILEIVLEKDQRGAFLVSDGDCARMMSKLGIDQRPGVHVESSKWKGCNPDYTQAKHSCCKLLQI